MLTNRCLVTLCCVVLISGHVLADDAKDPKTAFLTSEEAGLVFALQGEYSGTIRTGDNDVKLGMQVISEGGNKLAWVAYIGGLPGDGWDGNPPLRGTGEANGSTALLKGETGLGEIKNNSLVISHAGNTRLGDLAKVVRISDTMGRKPPEGAIVLFDGTTADHFENGMMDDAKLLMPGATSKGKFSSFEMHLEFMLSFMPNARGQARSNSGCYMQGRYEVQMLDSFGLTGENNECGGIYETRKPNLNMCFPPLSWQTYDVEYHAATFDTAGKKTADAWLTVKHNGVLIHEKVKLPRATRAAPLAEGPEDGPIYLQNHGGDPLRYRNIWVKPIAR